MVASDNYDGTYTISCDITDFEPLVFIKNNYVVLNQEAPQVQIAHIDA